MKTALQTLLGLALASLGAATAAAHDVAIPHAHPHPSGLGGDTVLILATLVCVAALITWLTGRAR